MAIRSANWLCSAPRELHLWGSVHPDKSASRGADRRTGRLACRQAGAVTIAIGVPGGHKAGGIASCVYRPIALGRRVRFTGNFQRGLRHRHPVHWLGDQRLHAANACLHQRGHNSDDVHLRWRQWRNQSATELVGRAVEHAIVHARRAGCRYRHAQYALARLQHPRQRQPA